MSAQIYSLPEELFVAIVTTEQEDRRARAVGLKLTGTVFKSEWALSHTCRRFRDAIVGAPALWTLIDIRLDLWEFPGCVEILKLYLQRSNGCHLSATLRSRTPEDHGFTKGLSEILLHVERLWKFAIILYTPSAAKVLAPLRDVGAPHLQNLEIVNIDDDLIGVGLFASGAPRLSFLRIDGLKLQLPAPSWTVALTHLELRKSQRVDDNSVLVAITAQCPSLVHLHIDLSWLRAEASHSRFYISTLKSLNITTPRMHRELFPLSALIDLFETPALAEFIIEGAHGDEIVDLFSSSSLPHASFPALTTLSFIHISPCLHDFAESFVDMQMCYPPSAVFPALSSLTLINQCSTSHLVKDILGQPWPQLKTLALCPFPVDSVFGADAFVAVGKVLRDTVRPDHNRRQRLPKLRLSPALLALEDWQDAGADVEVFDGVAVAESFQRLYSY
ncbi:hypothetical protein DFH08DRAFT_286020 [Mycena albidolilacea]|uniref:F-box domain-containing protein n=1 Tax=Mycena albidolilacea TaxID=1033008 RepID=A0AAD6ZRR5_9AGAR|nr:hypothetical protein DFH08DRAFT_286020 [Mycena albidolilacea]